MFQCIVKSNHERLILGIKVTLKNKTGIVSVEIYSFIASIRNENTSIQYTNTQQWKSETDCWIKTDIDRKR